MYHIKKTLVQLLLLVTINAWADDAAIPLVIDGDIHQETPKRYRMMVKNKTPIIASGQLTSFQLQALKEKLKTPIIIVDLRQESHGFLNGLPISWYGPKNWANRGLSDEENLKKQNRLLDSLKHQKAVQVHRITNKNKTQGTIETEVLYTLKPQKIQTEEDFANSIGVGYKRFYISDHVSPNFEQVKTFYQFMKTVPDGTWVYIHCRGGAGRTTTFMTLYDIFEHGKITSLDAILDYQVQLGGKDLRKLPEKTSFKYADAVRRLNRVKQIHQFFQKNEAIQQLKARTETSDHER